MRHTEPFLLSRKGSTRATAYEFGNKSVTLEGKTHVVWLDAVAKVRGRTCDRAARKWGETIELFDGCDNHTNPALTADAAGRIHLAYGPHGWWGNWNAGCFKHVVSKEPNSIAAWQGETNFGYNATYACIQATPAGLDCIAYRGGEPPASLLFQKQRPLGGWTTARALMRQDIPPQYTHVGAHIVCDARGTLYVAGHFYNLKTHAKSLGSAVLKSADMGETWTGLRGDPAALPILYDRRFAVPHSDADARLMGLALDSKSALWAMTLDPGAVERATLLSRWNGSEWETADLARFLPKDRVAVYGSLTLDARDRIHVVVTGVLGGEVGDGGKAWGHPSSEVFHLVSTDGAASFECAQVSVADGNVANWLPNISLAGPFHPVESPAILYTHGVPGEGCSPLTETEVYCVFVEE